MQKHNRPGLWTFDYNGHWICSLQAFRTGGLFPPDILETHDVLQNRKLAFFPAGALQHLQVLLDRLAASAELFLPREREGRKISSI